LPRKSQLALALIDLMSKPWALAFGVKQISKLSKDIEMIDLMSFIFPELSKLLFKLFILNGM
jgi:hypothetical protein